MSRGKYLCANRYTGGKCGGRVRTCGTLCRQCEEEREYERRYRRIYGNRR